MSWLDDIDDESRIEHVRDHRLDPRCIHEPTLVNYDPIWHDGDVICRHCGGWIRSFDAG